MNSLPIEVDVEDSATLEEYLESLYEEKTLYCCQQEKDKLQKRINMLGTQRVFELKTKVKYNWLFVRLVSFWLCNRIFDLVENNRCSNMEIYGFTRPDNYCNSIIGYNWWGDCRYIRSERKE